MGCSVERKHLSVSSLSRGGHFCTSNFGLALSRQADQEKKWGLTGKKGPGLNLSFMDWVIPKVKGAVDRKSTRLNSSHSSVSRMPSSA